MFEIYEPKGKAGPLFGIVVGSAGFLTFLYFFYIRYYKWRDCFNDLGRCYNPDGSFQVYTTGGIVWALISFPFFLLACVSLFILLRRGSLRRRFQVVNRRRAAA